MTKNDIVYCAICRIIDNKCEWTIGGDGNKAENMYWERQRHVMADVDELNR